MIILSIRQSGQAKIDRIGLMIPSANIAMEVEFYKYLPSNIIIHASRMKLKSITKESLHRNRKGNR